ncbi:ribonuclease H-like domain-containing protein [Truepera radiovictrix]|uniref:ribonuclease H-like domain-containing protein n=1 Tax=Truepera radiovictrix TaxID=332249 RepID=UPI0002EF194D|nr:ribonuclease H-like domain-containing protein [Truepera radiovictrix]WMT58512.1 ribonuclease H-like domain-containing protein [Truepera radiovictrix]
MLDLETERSFDEVGGTENRAQLGVSIVGVYSYENDRFHTYRRADFSELERALRASEQIIGFNLVGFDWPVLAAELGDWVLALPTLDLMVEAQRALGRRVSLDALARATLGTTKLGSGLDALAYFRAGDWERLERYCLEDVKLTRDLYEYARRHGQLFYQKGSRRAPIPMSFTEHPLGAVFRQALKTRAQVQMSYGGKVRLVDVTAFDGAYIRGFCHLRQKPLTFRLDKVEEAMLVASSTPLF